MMLHGGFWWVLVEAACGIAGFLASPADRQFAITFQLPPSTGVAREGFAFPLAGTVLIVLIVSAFGRGCMLRRCHAAHF